MDPADLDAAQKGDEAAFGRLVAPHRRELQAHCYRMSGSLFDAEELLQETLIRAWKGLGRWERRASLRTWLFRIATNVCVDELQKRPSRALPMDLGPANEEIGEPRYEPIWIEPCPAPLSSTARRETVAFAFLVALQRLPPRQRAALLLKDVVGYDAEECAELLDMTVAGINSALQRARATLSLQEPADDIVDAETQALLDKYVAAWERADVGSLVALLREDAVLSMPPIPQWLQGRAAIALSLSNMVLPPSAAGLHRLMSVVVNGAPGFALYGRDDDGALRPRSLHAVHVEDGAIATITAFLDPKLFPLFDLPPVL